jgi:hypothetical protein
MKDSQNCCTDATCDEQGRDSSFATGRCDAGHDRAWCDDALA